LARLSLRIFFPTILEKIPASFSKIRKEKRLLKSLSYIPSNSLFESPGELASLTIYLNRGKKKTESMRTYKTRACLGNTCFYYYYILLFFNYMFGLFF